MLGPCLIKFAQWIATRPDIFPMTLCQELSHMQNKVLTKVDYAHAEHALIQAFGNDWNKSLTLDKNSYLGSGCVAQVLHITHSLTHSLTHLLTYLLTYSLTHLIPRY